MNFKFSDIVIGIIFAGLIIGTALLQNDLKNEPQITMFIFGIMTIASFFAKVPFKTSVPFYILLGTMIYINVFILTNLFVNIISPDDGWVVDSTGQKHRVMQMNWIWGVLSGIVFASISILIYHKLIKRNRILEISLTTIFVIVTIVIFVKKELF